MNTLSDAILWLNDPLNWTNPGGLLERLSEHLQISFWAVFLGCVIGWPVGIWLGHRGRGGAVVITFANLTLALPTLALLTILPLTPIGFGKPPVVVALAVFAIPPLLSNAYTGLRSIDPEIKEAAKGMGLSGGQVLRRVELPLAVPYLAAGLRTAAVQVVATTTLATFVNGGGLGEIISAGFGLGISVGGNQIVAGGIFVVLLALAVEGLLALVQRLVTPRPLRAVKRRRPTAAAPAG